MQQSAVLPLCGGCYQIIIVQVCEPKFAEAFAARTDRSFFVVRCEQCRSETCCSTCDRYVYARCKALCASRSETQDGDGSLVKQREYSSRSDQIEGEGWLQDANCSSEAVCADVRRRETGILHGAVASVDLGKPSAGNLSIQVASQHDCPVRLVTGGRLRLTHPFCTVSSGNSADA